MATVGVECGAPITAHVGRATGSIATGMLGSRQVSFGMWGDCVGRAIELSESAAAGQILADESLIAEHLDNARIIPVDGATAETGAPLGSAQVLEAEEPVATE